MQIVEMAVHQKQNPTRERVKEWWALLENGEEDA